MPPAASFFIRKYLPKNCPASLFDASGMDDIHQGPAWSAASADGFLRPPEGNVRGKHGSRTLAVRKGAMIGCILGSGRAAAEPAPAAPDALTRAPPVQ